VAEALRTANAARARRPEVPVVIAADTGGKSPAGVRVFDRWNETEELLLDIERLLGERLARTAPQDVSDDGGVVEEERPGPFVNR
jgi:hypothetical protein